MTWISKGAHLTPIKPAQPNQSIIMGVTVLQEVVTANIPLGSREVARRHNLEHSRVNRVFGTLVHIGIRRQDDRKKFSAGPGIHALSARSLHASGLVPGCLGPLSELLRPGATVAAVFPEKHELMQNPNDMQTKVEKVARTIEQNIQHGGRS